MHPALDPRYAYIDFEHVCTLCVRESAEAGRYPIRTKTVCIDDAGDNIINLCDKHLLLLLELLFQKE